MELYQAKEFQAGAGSSLNLMMLGCDLASQETYLGLLKSQTTSSDQQSTITDYIVKKVEADTDVHKVTVFSNPYSSVTEIPQTTFKKADGFFLVYDAQNEQSAACLSDYLESIRENAPQGDLAPVVLLGINHQEGREEFASEWIEDLLVDHQIHPNAHFQINNEREVAEESFTLLSRQTLWMKRVQDISPQVHRLDEPNELWSARNVDSKGNALPKEHKKKRICFGNSKC